MISADSRYSDSTLAALDVGGGSRQVIVPGAQSAWSFSYITHLLAGHERPDSLASDYYGDATKWWKIADGNPEILDWSAITPGTILRIPLG